jgi:hypothetical protein
VLFFGRTDNIPLSPEHKTIESIVDYDNGQKPFLFWTQTTPNKYSIAAVRTTMSR